MTVPDKNRLTVASMCFRKPIIPEMFLKNNNPESFHKLIRVAYAIPTSASSAHP